MKLIIDISDKDYKECKFRKDLLSLGGEPTELTFNMRMEKIIGNGTPLFEGHGDLIDRDKLLNTLEKLEWIRTDCSVDEDNTNILEDIIGEVPTVIEADKIENEE